MSRLLNAEIRPPAATAPCAPQVEEFDLYGRRLMLDCNSLAVVELPGDCAAPPIAASGVIGCRCAPQFPLRAGPPRKLVLNLTSRCNLACRYCFVQSDRPDPSDPSDDMSAAVASRALALLPGDPDVAFFGGEPLLCWDRLIQVAALARARSPNARLHVTTNATLIDAERAAWLKAHRFSVLVSLDGPETVHDANRSGSWAATMAGLRCLAAAGLRPFLRATFDDPDTDLVELLSFFSTICNPKSAIASGVSIEPAVLCEGCATSTLHPSDLSHLSDRYHQAAAWYVTEARVARPLDWMHVRKMLQRVLYTRHCVSECGAGVGYVGVGPDGSIHACHKLGCPIGHVEGGIDESLRAAWADNRLYQNPECAGCWARWLCGGGCRHHRLVLGGGLHAPTPALCEWKRLLIRECLWILAELGPDRCREFIRCP